MTQDELKYELKEVEAEYNLQQKAIYKKFAFSNNPYKAGDIISDHVRTIKIELISVYVSNGISTCIYEGTKLNKNGTVAKRQDDNVIYQENIIFNHKQNKQT